MPMRHLTVTGTPTAPHHQRIAHQIGLGHQAGAEASHLYPVRGAADIKIDFAVAEVLADLRGLRQPRRIAAAQLQGDRVFAGVEPKSRRRSPCSTASAVTISV